MFRSVLSGEKDRLYVANDDGLRCEPESVLSTAQFIRGLVEVSTLPAQNVEFLARSITVGEMDGVKVVVGSPLYVALASHASK